MLKSEIRKQTLQQRNTLTAAEQKSLNEKF